MKVTIVEKCMNCGWEFKTPKADYNDLPGRVNRSGNSTFPIPTSKRVHICTMFGKQGSTHARLEKGLIEIIGCIEEEE